MVSVQRVSSGSGAGGGGEGREGWVIIQRVEGALLLLLVAVLLLQRHTTRQVREGGVCVSGPSLL